MLVPGETPIDPVIILVVPTPKATELLPKAEKLVQAPMLLFTVLALAYVLTKDPLANVMALTATARPFKTDLAWKSIAVKAMIVPTVKLSEPSVAALPTDQKTRDS